MHELYNRQGQALTLSQEIKKGGEGTVWQTNLNGYVAKIYHSPDQFKKRKIEIMLNNPPDNPTAKLNHTSIVWPTDLLQDSRNNFVGFLMPYIQQSENLITIYNPKMRKKKCPEFNWKYLHNTAKNIAWVVQRIHDKGYIIGDMKDENILVNNRSLISIVDTDSFQVIDSTDGQVFRCPVVSERFTPPELLGINASEVTQSKEQDYFRLAVIIYLLLFTQHPFEGEWRGQGEPLKRNENIRRGYWPYAPNSPVKASRLTIPLDVVHPRLKELFLKCFNEGHTQPTLRPSAKDWQNGLEIAIEDLTNCVQISNHVYSQTYASIYNRCYWCDRNKNLGVDIFLSSQPTSIPTPPPNPPSQSKTLILVMVFIIFILVVLFLVLT